MTARGLTLALAESCTGGLVGSRVTDVPGSSVYFVGGIVAYSNDAKMGLLRVDRHLLETFGAVSAQCAVAMARGARQALDADVALATTGIAGPSGGSPEKPVGLIYIAVVGPHGERCDRHTWPGNRLENKLATADAALDLLERYLTEVA